MTDDVLPPEDFPVATGRSRRALAMAVGVPPQRVLEIVHGRRAEGIVNATWTAARW